LVRALISTNSDRTRESVYPISLNIMKLSPYTDYSTETTQHELQPLKFSAAEMFHLMDKRFLSGSSPSTEHSTQQLLTTHRQITEDNAEILSKIRTYGINQQLIDKYTANIRKLAEDYTTQQQNEQRKQGVKHAVIDKSGPTHSTIAKPMDTLVSHTNTQHKTHKSHTVQNPMLKITGDNLLKDQGLFQNCDSHVVSTAHNFKLNNKFKCNNKFKDKIKEAVNTKLQSTPTDTIHSVYKPTYATIVKQHPPNVCNPLPVHKWALSPMTNQTKINSNKNYGTREPREIIKTGLSS
jgi:hypothetical protein